MPKPMSASFEEDLQRWLAERRADVAPETSRTVVCALIEALAKAGLKTDRLPDGSLQGAIPLDTLLDAVEKTLEEQAQKAEAEQLEWGEFLSEFGEQMGLLVQSLHSASQQASISQQVAEKDEVSLDRQAEELDSRARLESSPDQIRSTVHQRVGSLRARLDDIKAKRSTGFVGLQSSLMTLASTIRQMAESVTMVQKHRAPPTEESLRDAVTGAGNRHALEFWFRRTRAHCKRYAKPATLMLFELDGVVLLRKEFGAVVADRALQVAATLLSAGLRETDIITRPDEDCFVVLLAETDLELAAIVAKRLCAKIAESTFHHAGTPVALTVACGYAMLRADDKLAGLWERARTAAAVARGEGANRYHAADA